jgi:hypothetical protein
MNGENDCAESLQNLAFSRTHREHHREHQTVSWRSNCVKVTEQLSSVFKTLQNETFFVVREAISPYLTTSLA